MSESPVIIYDGTCGFCRHVVGWIRQRAGNQLIYIPQSKASFPVTSDGGSLPTGEFGLGSRSVMLLAQGRLYNGASAVYKALALLGSPFCWNFYQSHRSFALLSDAGYRVISLVRPGLSILLDLTLGPPPEDL